MKFQILKKEDFTPNKWSGGDTTELFIYPEHCKYSDKDFLFRLSLATIEVEESIFTPLNGYLRKLLVLKGELELSHLRQHTTNLSPYNFDSFDGSWETSSKGKANPFNTIYKSGIEVSYKSIKSSNEVQICETLNSDFTFLYVITGDIAVTGQEIRQGDLVKVQKSFGSFPVKLNSNTNLLIVKINL